MSKAVMLSIQPKWCELIASGKKTIEVRKIAPKCDMPFKCYIYETRGGYNLCNKCDKEGCYGHRMNARCYKGRGKVIGEFVCDYIWDYYFWQKEDIDADTIRDACLSHDEIWNYGKGKTLYGWHISDLKIYDTPKELGEFFGYGECEPDPIKCHACRYIEHGNSWAGIEADCDAAYEGLKQLRHPPQSWCYVEELSE